MAARSLDERVEIVEKKVGDLEQLPARMDGVESQILQLRGEMGDGFSAIDRRFDETNRHMRVLHEEVLRRISLVKKG